MRRRSGETWNEGRGGRSGWVQDEVRWRAVWRWCLRFEGRGSLWRWIRYESTIVKE